MGRFAKGSIGALFSLLLLTNVVHAGTSTFDDLDSVADSVGQEFYRAWRLRISALKSNYQQVNHQNQNQGRIDYLANSTSDCSGVSGRKKGTPVASIVYSAITTASGLDERFDFYGCSGSVLVTEELQRTGTKLTPLTSTEISQGVRRFSRAQNETRLTWRLIDPKVGTLLTVDSNEIPNGTVTQFLIQSNPYMTIEVSQATPDKKVLRYDLFPYRFKYIVQAHQIGSRDTDKQTYQVVQQNGDNHYSIGIGTDYISKIQFEKAFSDHVLDTQEYTGGFMLTAVMNFMPTIADQAPSIGANQKILNELNLAINRVTKKTELDQVRTLLQSYVNAINAGQIVIDDRRPQ